MRAARTSASTNAARSLLVAAGGEHLLELIDSKHAALAGEAVEPCLPARDGVLARAG